MEKEIISEVINILSDLFNVSREELDTDSSPDTVEAWDSLQHLNLVLDVEERFNIHLFPVEIEAMVTVQAIADIIDKKIQDV